MNVSVATLPRELGELQRDVLVVLALADRPSSRTHWQQQVRAAGIKDSKGNALTGEGFKQIVLELRREGGISEPYPGNYTIDWVWMSRVLEDAERRGRLQAIAAGLASEHYVWNRSGAYGAASLSPTPDLRRALGEGNADAMARVLSRFPQIGARGHENVELIGALGLFPPLRWIERLTEPHRASYLRSACHLAFTTATRLGDDVLTAALGHAEPEIRARAATVLALRGSPDVAERLSSHGEPTSAWETGALGFVALTAGRWDDARACFAAASKGARGQYVPPPSYLAVFALLALGGGADIDGAVLRACFDKAKPKIANWPRARSALSSLVGFLSTGRAEPIDEWSRAESWIDPLIASLVESWTGASSKAISLTHVRTHADAAGYAWLAERAGEEQAGHKGERSLHALRGKRRAPWELGLDALLATSRTEPVVPSARAPGAASGEIHWSLAIVPWGGLRATARLVTERSRSGKSLSVERLRTDDDLPLETRDRAIVEALVSSKERRDPDLPLRHLALFVGHPRVRDENGEPIRVLEREATLHAVSTKHGSRLTLSPAAFDISGAAITEEDGALVLVRRTPLAARLLEVLGPEGLLVPEEGLARMREVLGALSASLPVSAPETLATEAVPGDPGVRVQLFRAGAGLRARVRVVPGGSSGAAFRPGRAPDEIVVSGASGLCRVRRDLARERESEEALLERCPMLASLPLDGDDRTVRDLDACLELLLELRSSGALVDWPEGQALRAPTLRHARDVRVRVGGGATWLDLKGEVQLEEDRVIAMTDLLAAASKATGRFVPIGEDEYIALTEDVRAKLDALARVQQLGTKGRLSAALLPAMDGWLEGLDVTWSADLQRRREALSTAIAQKAPPVPRALQAELRDYQRDGFTFLVRHAEAGTGACLADDMGLGKTVQALALLLHRKARGPALVVAPMSVCRNWEAEIARFAPTLRIRRLAEGDREETVLNAKAGDVVIASYGLLVTEEETLAKRRWSTLVFDEAHALKNAATRRWAAARAVPADAVVALTGTPVENHIGELHAVFDVIVPGLLGPRAAFDRAFGAALAEGRRDAVGTLRQIVRPLVLRRTKAQVLEELPPKTEMTRVVAPTPEHRAFYEAVRRRAVERVEAAAHKPGGGGAQAGQAHIQILAEITRLRRAAIDPRLVGGSEAPPGAKLDALAELILELREEGHRALVFSQFLEVLDLAKAKLEALSVECRRLDGTMSQAARAAEVDAFQSGRGDVFLLSLKAGGVGMNLTGADFVVHLDPWWNPAVEDQASDRAHRIGQTRAVTVVRLVTEGTIEEKVLELHGKKRKLYEDVIGAADGTGPLDVDALAELLAAT